MIHGSNRNCYGDRSAAPPTSRGPGKLIKESCYYGVRIASKTTFTQIEGSFFVFMLKQIEAPIAAASIKMSQEKTKTEGDNNTDNKKN